MTIIERANISKKALYLRNEKANILILNSNLSNEETGQIIKGYITKNIKKADSSMS